MYNWIAGFFALFVFGVSVFEIQGNAYWTDFAPGPAFFPYWIAGIGSFLACLLLIQTILRGRTGQIGQTGDGFHDLKNVGIVIALLAGLIALLPIMGLLPGGAVFMLVMLTAILRRKILPSLLTVVITISFIYGVFDLWLGIDLPYGVLNL